ncbi:porin family protein [Zobellella aerophila]|uniref:Outer membrane protein beta-barrel domain-containing protein n=1 Tax=Zobellella aerophila TaxID=870480 RepID=A0ABP6V4N2_9GAMM
MIKPILVASCLVAASAHAQSPVYTSWHNPDYQFYVGLNYANLDFDTDSLSESVNWDSVGLNLGFQPSPYLAVEGRLGKGFGDDTVAGVVKTELEHYYGVYLLPQFPIEDVMSVYGLLGWTEAEAEASAPAFGLKESDSESDLSYGVGVRFLGKRHQRGVGFFAEYARLLDKDDFEMDALTVGLTWHF